MTREELVALRDAIDTVLTWPEAVRAEIARWLAPEAAKASDVSSTQLTICDRANRGLLR